MKPKVFFLRSISFAWAASMARHRMILLGFNCCMVKGVTANSREYAFCVRLFGQKRNPYLRFRAIAAVCIRDAERRSAA
jgi:hypothetical protein